jgi:hypothetical protein
MRSEASVKLAVPRFGRAAPDKLGRGGIVWSSARTGACHIGDITGVTLPVDGGATVATPASTFRRSN